MKAEQPRRAPPGGREARAASQEVLDTGAGQSSILAAWLGTGLFAATAGGATVSPRLLDVPALAVALILFFAGLVLMVVAYAIALDRSRRDEISVAGLFLLSGSAPRRVRRHLFGALATQVAVAVVTGGIRPFTSIAFGTLVPMYGLGLNGLWGARHGTFPRRATTGRGR